MLKISALTVGLGLLIGVSGCQTFSGLGDSIGEALGTRQAEILESQKSIVVNYLDQGKPQAALPEVRRLVQEHPNNAEVLNLAGLTHLSLKNSRVAVRYFELSLDRKSEPGVALNLSSALIETKQFDRASKVLRDLIVDGSVREYRYRERIFHNLGVIAQQSGKPQLAAKYYDRAIEENPVFYKSHLQKARM
jgi:Tfp pilus assembly protein PilF